MPFFCIAAALYSNLSVQVSGGKRPCVNAKIIDGNWSRICRYCDLKSLCRRGRIVFHEANAGRSSGISTLLWSKLMIGPGFKIIIGTSINIFPRHMARLWILPQFHQFINVAHDRFRFREPAMTQKISFDVLSINYINTVNNKRRQAHFAEPQIVIDGL